MKRTALLAESLAAACRTAAPPTAPPQVKTTAETLAIAPDTPHRLEQLPRTVIDCDRSLLNENLPVDVWSVFLASGEQ